MLESVANFNKLSEFHYHDLRKLLTGLTEEELDWHIHPEANTIRWILGHLRWFEDWTADAIESTGRYGKDMGPLAYEFDDLELFLDDYDKANERRVKVYSSLTEADMEREVDYFGAYNASISSLVGTHAGHTAGHRYQIRMIRGTYSRAKGTDKSAFDPW